MAGNYGPVRFSVLADEHHVVMNYRNTVRLEQQIVSTEAGLAATIGFSSARPVGGKMFLLTAPFIERPLRTATRRSWQPGGFGDSCLPDGIFHGALDYRFVEVMPTPDAVSRSM